MFDILLRNYKDQVYRLIFTKFCSFMKSQHILPNHITSISFLIGLISCLSAFMGYYNLSLLFWILNRMTDGLDGVYARLYNLSSDFGGYYDIVTDFIVYSLVPISLTFSKNHISQFTSLTLSLMLSTFFVNSCGQFYLSAILEKKNQKNLKELTTITMPASFIEGAETLVFFSFFFIFHDSLGILFLILGFLVSLNVVHRLKWAYENLS